MLYAVLKSIHLLAIIVWVGGMFFMLYCLRPMVGTLDPAARLPLMRGVMQRFFAYVTGAVVLVIVTGAWMLGSAARPSLSTGLQFALPLDWDVMIVLGAVMAIIFVHVRWVLFRRLGRAADAGDKARAAALLERIRLWVSLNLLFGAVIVVVTRIGGSS